MAQDLADDDQPPVDKTCGGCHPPGFCVCCDGNGMIGRYRCRACGGSGDCPGCMQILRAGRRIK